MFDHDETLAEARARNVRDALYEDIGRQDWTGLLIPADKRVRAVVRVRESAILCGRDWFCSCLSTLDPTARIDWHYGEGATMSADTDVCHIDANARALLSAERPALNFLQLLSATATVTAEYVAAVAGTAVRVLDTRKTIPGLRLAQKYAVRCGGGHNQRMGLYDAILIKENHIIAAGSIAAAVQAARRLHPDLLLEVEVENLDELEQALQAGVDRIMLDNFELAQMREAVQHTAGRVPLEVSGNVDLRTIGEYAHTGVDFISVGALTKHVRAVDLSLRLQLD